MALEVLNFQYGGEDVEEDHEYHDMLTYMDSDPHQSCILVNAVNFWAHYMGCYTLFLNFKEPYTTPDKAWTPQQEGKMKVGEAKDWLKTPDLFAKDFKIKDKHFRSKEDPLVAQKWSVVLNVIGQRYFELPMKVHERMPHGSVIGRINQMADEEQQEKDSPQLKRTRGESLGAASAPSIVTESQEKEENQAIPEAKKQKKKPRTKKEFVVTLDSQLRANMPEENVKQAFEVMRKVQITSNEGIAVSAAKCIEPPTNRLARPLDKKHVAYLVNAYKKEGNQGGTLFGAVQPELLKT